MDLKELECGVDPHRNWYYQSKLIPLIRFFEKAVENRSEKVDVIDFGAGNGFFSKELLKRFPEKIETVRLVDIEYEKREVSADGKIVKSKYVEENERPCVVILMDVIEHIENDEAALRQIQKVLKDQPPFFLTVPAFQSLWSGHDIFLEHFRRYKVPHLEGVLKKADFGTKKGYYIFSGIFPLVWLVRSVKNMFRKGEMPASSDMAPLPGPINALLKFYHSIEMRLNRGNRLFGLTCVAEGNVLTETIPSSSKESKTQEKVSL